MVTADPGCGKSVLAKYLVDHELPQVAHTYYFFFKDQVQNSLNQALCALNHQVLSAEPSLVRHAMPEYSKNGSQVLSVTSSLWNILFAVANDSQLGSVIFVLDALDECKESDFLDLAQALKGRWRTGGADHEKIRWILTSRPYEQITSEFEALVKMSPCVRIPGEEESDRISQEVNAVVRYRVDRLAEEKGLRSEIKDHLLARLLAIDHWTCLWVYLIFNFLKQGFKKTKRGIKLPLTKLPETVNEAYEDILSKSSDPEKAHKVLCIVLAAQRPLTLQEMNIAANIETSPFTECLEDLDLETEHDFRITLRNCCGLFLSIYNGRVYFLHQTAREFLIPKIPQTKPTCQPHWGNSIEAQRAHKVLAGLCVGYLHLKHFKDGDIQNDDSGRTHEKVRLMSNSHPFFEYSSRFWYLHCAQGDVGEENDELLSMAIVLCDNGNGICNLWKVHHPYKYRTLHEDPALLVLSSLGIRGAVKMLLGRGVDVNTRNDHDESALNYAVDEGMVITSELLLRRGAVVDGANVCMDTALHGAAIAGHESLVSLFLSFGAQVDLLNDRRESELVCAINRGHEGIAKILLEHGADFRLHDFKGHTALHRAAQGKKADEVELLLQRIASINVQDHDKRTPLHWAARSNKANITRMLLHKGASMDAKDHDKRTPLHWASRLRCKDSLAELIESGANVDVQDMEGFTALHSALSDNDMYVAAIYGSSELIESIRLLLDGGANPNIQDDLGRVLLHFAAVNHRFKGATSEILKHGANVRIKDKEQKTPLHYTANEDNRDTVLDLLVYGADINAQDSHGWTPLHYAVIKGYEDIVSELIKHGANLDVEDKVGSKPADYAYAQMPEAMEAAVAKRQS